MIESNKIDVAISVITYNHEKYIAHNIDNLLNQQKDFRFKIFITDDHSTDKTAEICQKYQQKHPDLIDFESYKKNIGPVENWIVNFNKCINSRAEFIALCDGDDYWTDHFKLKKQLKFLESNPDYGMVYSDQSYVDKENQLIPPNPYYLQRKTLYDSGDIFWKLLENNFINTSTACFRAHLIRDFFPDQGAKENTWFLFDYWLWLMIARKSKIRYLDEILATYRTHGNNLTMQNFFSSNRNSLIKLEIISQLNRYEIDTTEKKEIVTKNLISIFLKKKIGFKNKRKIMRLILKNRVSLLFIIKKASSKYLK